MKFAYKFNNLLGAVYCKGDLIFSRDGSTVISPVGNRITIYDLKNHKSTTLPIESRFNYEAIDLSPNGSTLIAINEQGEAHIISMISKMVVQKKRLNKPVTCIKFSPDGKYFALCKEKNVFVYTAPSHEHGEYNLVELKRTYDKATNTTTTLCWSSDSKLLAVGSADTTTRIYSIEKWANIKSYILGGHSDSIVSCFFEKDSYDLTTISKNGQLCVWECSIEPEDMIPYIPMMKKTKRAADSDSEDDVDLTKAIERSNSQKSTTLSENSSRKDDSDDENESKNVETKKLYYKKLGRHYLSDEVRTTDKSAVLTAASYHHNTHTLVVGYSNGLFLLYEMPEVSLMQSLNLSSSITTISFNPTGDWIAFGSAEIGQLIVWEWQSQTFIMKQQGHSNNINSLAYSPDGQFVVTGGDDGALKIWDTTTGFCVNTAHKHASSITDVAFSHNRLFVVSASLDGTVRAYNINNYTNFKTFTSWRPVQFSCVALDASDEFLTAGCQDYFEIYLWSVKTGKLLEVLKGHEGPVASVAFSPSIASTAMASVAWDKTLKLWDAIEKGSAHETIQLTADGLCVAFKPNGEEVAVSTLDGQISFFNCRTSVQNGSIEGRKDLGSGRSDTDLITAEKNLATKAFTSLCYSADGSCIIAGGQSKNVCIYKIEEGVLLKKFVVTQNRSFDAVDDFINRRKMTEFGNLDLIEQREDGGKVKIKIPGCKTGDLGTRSSKPEVRVYSLQFSPTGQAWAAATTEGLLIYSLDVGLIFDPFELDISITPESVKTTLKEKDYAKALMMALRLNEIDIIQLVVESIPCENIELTQSCLSQIYLERMLKFIATQLESTRHIHFYLLWVETILTKRGNKIKGDLHMPLLLALQKNMQKMYDDLSRICDFNQYTIDYIINTAKFKEARMISVNDDDIESVEMQID